MNIRSLTIAATVLCASPSLALAHGPGGRAGGHSGFTGPTPMHVQFRDRDDRRFDRDDRRFDRDRDRDRDRRFDRDRDRDRDRRFDRDDRGRRFFRGRWWDYGVGPCWRPTPVGYVWICG